MKRFFLTSILLLCFSSTGLPVSLVLDNTPCQVYFSPNGGCTEAIVREIGQAKNEVLVQAYSFTSKEIAEAVVNAHKRGVKVTVVLDRSQLKEQYSAANFLANAGIQTYIDSQHKIAHNKVIIIDEETVIGGSFNYSRAAEDSNAENVTIIKNKDFAKLFVANWHEHQKHSQPVAAKY
jgi:phosphatidylserine/phosphatidylglycerophosphate/cardiolipin synthase-like enzyme